MVAFSNEVDSLIRRFGKDSERAGLEVISWGPSSPYHQYLIQLGYQAHIHARYMETRKNNKAALEELAAQMKASGSVVPDASLSHAAALARVDEEIEAENRRELEKAKARAETIKRNQSYKPWVPPDSILQMLRNDTIMGTPVGDATRPLLNKAWDHLDAVGNGVFAKRDLVGTIRNSLRDDHETVAEWVNRHGVGAVDVLEKYKKLESSPEATV